MDITDAKTDEGFPYLAFVLGVYSRRIAGWSTGSHLGTGFVIDAPEMTAWRRKPAAGLVCHSDRSTRYVALSFGKRLEGVGIVPSIGGRARGAGQRHLGEFRVHPQTRARPSPVPSHQGGRKECRLRAPGGVLQPKEAALLARLREPGELLGPHGEGGCRGAARKRPPNRCNSRRGFGRGVTVLALLSSKMIRTEERAGQE